MPDSFDVNWSAIQPMQEVLQKVFWIVYIISFYFHGHGQLYIFFLKRTQDFLGVVVGEGLVLCVDA